MDTSNWINLGILVLTAVIGAVTWWQTKTNAKRADAHQRAANDAADRSARAAEEASALQKRTLAIEEQRYADEAKNVLRAKLKASREREETQRPTGNVFNDVLRISNTGDAAAQNIEMHVNGRPHTELNILRPHIGRDVTIGPGSRLDLKLRIGRGSDAFPPFQVVLHWDDPSGEPGRWVGTVG